MDIISNYIERARGVVGLACDFAELEQCLRSRLPWTLNTSVQENEGRFWQACSGKWLFCLAEFSIENQPNQAKGALGYNIIISNTDGIFLVSDGKIAHDLARLLNFYRMDIMQETTQVAVQPGTLQADFAGRGPAPQSRVVHMKQEQDYVLSEETMPAAIAWMQRHIESLNGAEWGILATQTWIRFDRDNRIAYWRGNPHPETFRVLRRMNWFVCAEPPAAAPTTPATPIPQPPPDVMPFK